MADDPGHGRSARIEALIEVVRADGTSTPRRYRNARATVAGLAILSVHQHKVPLFPTNGECAKVCDRCRDLRRGADLSVGFTEPTG